MSLFFLAAGVASLIFQIMSLVHGIRVGDMFEKPFYGYAIWGVIFTQLFIHLAKV